MATPTREKQALSNATAIFFANLWQQKRFASYRNAFCLFLFVNACGVWLLGLGQLGAGKEACPWYLAIAFFAAIAVRFLRSETAFVNLLGVPKSREPLKLQESLSMCYLAMALSLYSWIAYSQLHPSAKTNKIAQVIDIQLLSEQDYKNNHDQLPGSEPKDDLKKRQADQTSQMGSLTQSKLFQPEQKQIKKEASVQHADIKTAKSNGNSETDREEEKPAEKPAAPTKIERAFQQFNAAPLMIPQGWQTKTVSHELSPAAHKSASPSQPSENQPYISEVEPPELVELMENDGELDALHVYQKGGKSTGGKGAENGLSNYLKELHKKIKSAWNPPGGTTRKVQVQFRLKKDGRLAFLRISKTSGETITDNSAVKAIMVAAASGLPLPDDFKSNYLDVSYTFKYNVDELQELKMPAQN